MSIAFFNKSSTIKVNLQSFFISTVGHRHLLSKRIFLPVIILCLSTCRYVFICDIDLAIVQNLFKNITDFIYSSLGLDVLRKYYLVQGFFGFFQKLVGVKTVNALITTVVSTQSCSKNLYLLFILCGDKIQVLFVLLQAHLGTAVD